jgi:hypothetical protein
MANARKSRESVKGYRRIKEALVARTNRKKIAALAISVVPGPKGMRESKCHFSIGGYLFFGNDLAAS